MFYPSREDIPEIQELSTEMATQAVQILQRECHDKSKATPVYLSAINNNTSLSKVSEKELLAGRNIPATNCILQTTQAVSTVGFVYLYNFAQSHPCGGLDQILYNHNYYSNHNNWITRQSPKMARWRRTLEPYTGFCRSYRWHTS